MDRMRALIRCFSLLGKARKKRLDVNWVCMHAGKRDEYYDCYGIHRLNKKRRDRICNIVYMSVQFILYFIHHLFKLNFLKDVKSNMHGV
jgi:hypothetical protein